MTLRNDAKFKEKLTCPLTLKLDMMNLMSFPANTQNSKNFTSMGYFGPTRFELTK